VQVVIAPDSFKGSISAADAAIAIAEGWRTLRHGDDLRLIPQADGGEGTLDAIESSIAGAVRCSAGDVTGPDGRPTPGVWLSLPGGTAVIELAQSSGLPLMGSPDPLGATTRGLGEVIRHALAGGAEELVIALGGSASTDGGAGALTALGVSLTDTRGIPIANGGGALARLAHVDSSAMLLAPARGVTLLTDVDAPLLGPTGAAAVFGPQKGADAAQCARLAAALARFARLLGGDPMLPGSGAAGGTAFGLATAWRARIRPGAPYVARVTGLLDAIADADLLITGEGRFDAQSHTGKVVGHALGMGIRTAIIAGDITTPPPDWAISLTGLAGSVSAAIADPVPRLREAGAAAARALGH
jgi:glycerate kinase